MKRVSLCSLAILGLALLLGSWAAAGPYGPAIAGKFAECLQAEGGTATEEDRALLESAAGDLAGALDLTRDPEECPPDGQGSPSCTAAIQGMSCDTLSEDLLTEIASAIPPGPIAPWAEAYASALAEKTTECYEAETGEETSPPDRQKVAGFRQMIAAALSPMTESGACRLKEDALPVCTAWVRGRDCSSMLQDLASLAGSLGSAGSGDGSAPVEDVETMSEEELDARLQAETAQRKSLAQSLVGPCTELLDCEEKEASGEGADPP